MRIGLFGGTFNPIHSGHLWAAEKISSGFNLDEMHFIPAALPPHKPSNNLADVADRLTMIRLSIKNPKFVASDMELKRPGASYTIDTVIRFKKRFSPSDRLHLMVGLDAFLEIDTWKSHKTLFDLVPVIVMTRSREDAENGRERAAACIRSKISSEYLFSPEQSCFFHSHKKPIHFFDVDPLNISSTHIRKQIRAEKNIGPLIPEEVEDFINKKELYK